MNIVWFCWKDRSHPAAGGAEVLREEIAKRAVLDGHNVVFITSGYQNAKPVEVREGLQIVRVGRLWSVYFLAWREYRKNWAGSADVVIEEVNTIPFMTQWYVKDTKRFLFFHQLCREIWFYQMFFPMSFIGYILEPLYLFALRNNRVLTVSQSTKKDLCRFGFSADEVRIVTESVTFSALQKLSDNDKYTQPTLLALGTVRPMKRTLEQIKTFEYAKEFIPDLQLTIAGDMNSKYGKRVEKYIHQARYSQDVRILGKITEKEKKEVMRKSHLLLMTSTKEGWGLTVTEAATQGTPAVVYDVDGLRDSVCYDYQTRISDPDPESLGKKVVQLLTNKELYQRTRHAAWHESQEFILENTYETFKQAIL